MLNALVSSKQVHLKQSSETVCTDDQFRYKIRERVPHCGASHRKGPAIISIEPVTWYCKKLMVAGTQLSPSVSTGSRDTVDRQVQWSAAVQTPVNYHCQLEEHLIRDVKPMKLVVQYMTQAMIDIQSAGDDAHSCVQHML